MGKSGLALISRERRRQIDDKGMAPEHDAIHNLGEMAIAAACYATEGTEALTVIPGRQAGANVYHDAWPWGDKWDKREKHDRIKQLTIAGALIAAEIDRLIAEG